MSDALPVFDFSGITVSDALRKTLRPLNTHRAEIAHGYATGAIETMPARQRVYDAPLPYTVRPPRRLIGRKWQSSPNREASMFRKRKLGGSSSLPDTIRYHYTEGERAALAIVTGEVKHHGYCDLALDAIAAKAGVSRTTVQNAVRQAQKLCHLSVESRPQRGAKNLPNVLRVIAKDWLSWLTRGAAASKPIGFKTFHPSKNQDIYKGKVERKSASIDAPIEDSKGLPRGAKAQAVPNKRGECHG